MILNLSRLRRASLLLVALSLPISNISLTPIPYTQASLVAVYLALIAHARLLISQPSKVLSSYLAIPMFALLLVMVISTFAPGRPDPSNILSEMRQHFFYLVFFMTAIVTVKESPRFPNQLERTLLVAVSIPAIAFGIGLTNVVGYSERLTFLNLNPNLLAQYFLIGQIIVLDLFFTGTKLRRLSGGWRIILALLLVLFVFSLSLTGSRSGVIICIVAITTFFVFSDTSKLGNVVKVLVPGSMIVVIFAVFLLESSVFASRAENIQEDIRFTTLWPVAIDIFLSHPLFGAGLSELDGRLYAVTNRNLMVHNEFLRVAASSGLLGLSLLGLFVYRLFKKALQAKGRNGSGAPIAIAVAAILYLFQGGTLYALFPWVLFLYAFASSRQYSERKR